MIGRVSIDGADVALADVFASVTIRHGRAGVDDGPLASTASLSLVNIDREYALAFETEVELELYLEDDVTPRFVGTVTDAKLTEDGLSIIATGSLGEVSEHEIGSVDYPEETWSSRVRRVFAEAGAGNTWANIRGTWAEQTRTWASPFAASLFTIELGDDDPILLARPADLVTLASYLSTLLADVPAAIANLPDGSVLVQSLEYRKSLDVLELNPLLVAFAPEWSKVSDVVNVATVTYGAAELETTATDETSRAQFPNAKPVEISTDLRDAADAELLARTTVVRGGRSDWLVASAELLELDPGIAIGQPVELSALPAWAPFATHVGMVEGWTDHVVSDEDGELEWTMELALSSPRLSGYHQDWASVLPGLSWTDVTAEWSRPDSLFEA